MSTTIQRGQVISFYEKFGFISPSGANSDESSSNVYINAENMIVPEEVQRPFLIPGEYVQFKVRELENGKKEAYDLQGVDNGPLLCENKYMRGTFINYRRRVRTNRRKSENENKDQTSSD
jgi:hypothetical protein